MQKDIALKQLAEYEDVFAEIFNHLAFHGKTIVKAEELISISTEAIITETEGLLREKRRDIVKADKRGYCYHLIFDLENQKLAPVISMVLYWGQETWERDIDSLVSHCGGSQISSNDKSLGRGSPERKTRGGNRHV